MPFKLKSFFLSRRTTHTHAHTQRVKDSSGETVKQFWVNEVCFTQTQIHTHAPLTYIKYVLEVLLNLSTLDYVLKLHNEPTA